MKALKPGGPALLSRRWRLLRIGVSRRIEADPDAVWAVISDQSTWTDWQADYRQHAPVTTHTSGLQARFATTEWVFRYEQEIVRWEPPTALGSTIVRAASLRWFIRRYYTEIAVDPVPSEHACVVHYRVAFSGTWLFWLLGAYTAAQALMSISGDARASLRNLERLVAHRAAS